MGKAPALRAQVTLDMRGALCPGPVLEARRVLEGMKSDEVLRLVTSCPAARDEAGAWTRAEYDIVTPARGYKIIAEVLALGLPLRDRWAWGRLDDAQRAALVQAIGERLAATMESNVRGSRENFIDTVNRRGADYAGFDIPAGGAGFPVLRYLAAQVREAMDEHDQIGRASWRERV